MKENEKALPEETEKKPNQNDCFQMLNGKKVLTCPTFCAQHQDCVMGWAKKSKYYEFGHSIGISINDLQRLAELRQHDPIWNQVAGITYSNCKVNPVAYEKSDLFDKVLANVPPYAKWHVETQMLIADTILNFDTTLEDGLKNAVRKIMEKASLMPMPVSSPDTLSTEKDYLEGWEECKKRVGEVAIGYAQTNYGGTKMSNYVMSVAAYSYYRGMQRVNTLTEEQRLETFKEIKDAISKTGGPHQQPETLTFDQISFGIWQNYVLIPNNGKRK